MGSAVDARAQLITFTSLAVPSMSCHPGQRQASSIPAETSANNSSGERQRSLRPFSHGRRSFCSYLATVVSRQFSRCLNQLRDGRMTDFSATL